MLSFKCSRGYAFAAAMFAHRVLSAPTTTDAHVPVACSFETENFASIPAAETYSAIDLPNSSSPMQPK